VWLGKNVKIKIPNEVVEKENLLVQGLPIIPTSELWRLGRGFVWDGYILLNDGGTMITASGQCWLEGAVERFIMSSRECNGKCEAPTVLMTSFRLAK
jgi:hypothetical protein